LTIVAIIASFCGIGMHIALPSILLFVAGLIY